MNEEIQLKRDKQQTTKSGAKFAWINTV